MRKQKSLTHIFHFAAECYPVAKVGGLADVVGALPKYQQKAGLKASVIIPYYDKPFIKTHTFVDVYQGYIQQGADYYPYSVLKELNNSLGFELFLIKIPGLLDRPEVYSYPDEREQFLAYQHAALDWLCAASIRPDIIHCHDHHAGFIPFYIENVQQFDFLKGTPTVATVHNGQYQGWLDWDNAFLLPSFDTWKWGLLDWNGLINPLAALIKCCWAYTTVSEGYLQELYQEANGLESLFLAEKEKSYGIVNGIDTDVWDTKIDSMLTANFGITTIAKGKQLNKVALCSTYHLDENLPLIAFIGRFALEKGADILPSTLIKALTEFKGQLNFLILGSGDKKLEQALEQISKDYPEHFALYIGYNEELAHQVYASADYLFMPSRVEPCGLNQLYAMRYGTVPIVRSTGGLRDTVKDINTADGYGILFENATVEDAVEALQRAIDFWHKTNTNTFSLLRKKLMKLDFSWERSSTKYTELYNKLIN